MYTVIYCNASVFTYVYHVNVNNEVTVLFIDVSAPDGHANSSLKD
jgi:hypothetical protein